MQDTPRFYNSIAFWLLLGTLSLGIHGAIAFFLLQNLIRLDFSEPDFIPIELVAIPQEPIITPNLAGASPIPTPNVEVSGDNGSENSNNAGAIATPVPQSPASTPATPATSPRTSPSPPTPSPNSSSSTPNPAPPVSPSPPNPTSVNPIPPNSPPPTPSTPVPPTPTPPPSPPSPSPEPISPPTAPTSPPPSPPTPVLPAPTPPPNPSPPPSTPAQPSGINVTFGKFELSDTTRDLPDQLAAPRVRQKQLEAIAYLQTPDLNFTETLIIEVVFTIDQQGKFDAIQGEPRLIQASISAIAAREIAQEVLQNWDFEPSYMGGQPVYQSYRAQLTISPIF